LPATTVAFEAGCGPRAAGRHEQERGKAHQAAPAAADVVAGGVP
jgi:hypothetical protein